ncbi:hypothetical protein GL300_19645 [Paracoccus litorisediminis]|uniref:Uncharacterized protein n=2 Tax=Paracoccus litorisediminis TaxID=2006130 RepID=A0A844HV54_9RHOB|nr:hypothetical protein [Paracoccus litorisediminis]
MLISADKVEQGRALVSAAQAARQARQAEEAARLAEIRDAGAIPEECGPDIAPAPARGGFVLERVRHLEGATIDDLVETSRGYVRKSPVRCADAFDLMIAAALRGKRDMPLSPGQIAMGRRYAALVEISATDGTKLSCLDSSGGGGDSMDWMDRHLDIGRELDLLRGRIGHGVAMAVRRVRPTARGAEQRGPIMDRVLVDMVCLKGCTLDQVLMSHGWSAKGDHRKAVSHALGETLDRMIGYRMQKTS